MPKVSHISVTRAESGQKLLQFVHRQLQGQVPRSALMRWIRTGQIRVDGSRCKPFVRIRQGQVVRLPPYTGNEDIRGLTGRSANPFALRRVHEDQEILVLAKPPNLASQPGTGVEDSVSDRLHTEYAHSDWIPALVHRLDKATSGLILVAKTYASLQHLQRLWQAGAVTKVYLAWVQGRPDWPEWTLLRDVLPKESKGHMHQVQAEARVKTLRQGDRVSLLAVRLITGRKHQIRIQLSRRGYPVLGDRKFGTGKSGGQGLLLHAAVLGWENRCYQLAPPWEGEYAVSGEEMAKVQAGVSGPKFPAGPGAGSPGGQTSSSASS